jgi:lipopolysaccharide export system permease protein
MLPFSVYLTSRATKDRALIDLDAILIPMKKKLVKPIHLVDQKKVNNNFDFDSKIQHVDNSKLFELIKNYRFYGLSETKRKLALNELESRGIDCSAIEVSGKIINEKYNSGVRYIKDYHENSTLAVYGHIMFLIFGIFGIILKNKNLEELGYIFIFISILSLLLFLILFPKILNNQTDFYDLLDKKFNNNNAIFIILSIPLFFLYKIYFNKKMKEDLMKIK